MKKLLLAFALLASLSLEAQFVTSLAKNSNESQSDGVMYYLPRNVVRLEFTIEETGYYMGPYAEFASRMLGTTDYITENKTEFNIKNVEIQTFPEIDPTSAFIIEPDEKGKEPMPNIILDADGVIMAIGYDNIPSGFQFEHKTFDDSDMNTNERVVVSFIEILDSEVELDDDDDDDDEGDDENSLLKKKNNKSKTITKEDKAKTALEKISNAQNAYFELISGA